MCARLAAAVGTGLSWVALGAYLVHAYGVGDVLTSAAVPLLDRTVGE